MYRGDQIFCPFISYDAVGDVDGCFPKEFRNYIGEQDLLCGRRDGDPFRLSNNLLWFSSKEHQLDSTDSAYTHTLDKIFSFFNRDWYEQFLVQIWKAEEVNSGNHFDRGHFRFTTKNQPSLLVGRSNSDQRLEKLCTYRMRTVDINNGDEGAGKGGVIDRVFRNKRMEFTPYVGYYSYEESPSRDLALSCGIQCSLALPLSDSTGRPLGVLELVSTCMLSTLLWSLYQFSLLERIPLRMLQEECLDYCRGLCGHYHHTQGNYENCVAEIKEVMTSIGKSCNLVHGQTWMLCKLCNSISTCEKFGKNLNASFSNRKGYSPNFMYAQRSYILKAEEGVVGKAASSHRHIVYCKDVTEFRISDYPLAHFARYDNFFAACAISLRSIYTGDQVYVIEFVLDPSRDLWATLVSIIQAMRDKFRTFKLASGEEFRNINNLSVQVIDASSPDKIVILENWLPDLTLTIGVNNGIVVRPYLLQGSIGENSFYGTDDSITETETSFADTSMEEAHGESFSTVKCELRMTVKAYYGDTSIKIQLSNSSGIDFLHEQVSQRFNLENGTYFITYQDKENDPVLIECDEDVHEYISCSSSLEVYVLSIELKNSS